MAFQKSSHSDVYQIITDRLVAIMEKGQIPWQKPWKGGSAGMPANLVSRRAYTGINIFMLSLQGYDSPYWLTFRQANEMGGHVRKGEKGTPVIFAKKYEKEVEDADGEVVEVLQKSCLRYYTVFNALQCEGIDLPEIAPVAENDNQPIELAESIWRNMPNAPQIHFGGSRAFYRPSEDSVTVPPIGRHISSENFYATLFHELAHSTGHASRLNRPIENAFGSNPYAREELVAEMTSAYIMGCCGLENPVIENSAAYLQSWIRALKGDTKLAIHAAAAAQRAADYILGNAE